MEWFDVKSIATLFGVANSTVHRWIRAGLLPALSYPSPFYDPEIGKPRMYRTYHVSRPALEHFLINHYHTRNRNGARVTVESLIKEGQLYGDIHVTVQPEMPDSADRPQESLRALNAIYARKHRNGRLPASTPPRTLTAPDRKQLAAPNPHPPVQLELFPVFGKDRR